MWAGVDSVWEQKKLEARKMLENVAESPASGAPRKSGAHFSREKPSSDLVKYTSKRQDNKPYKAMETREVAVPRCTVVAGQIDLYTGGEVGKDPDEKANSLSDRVLSIIIKGVK